MPRERTHWEGCWRTHHECALVRIEALEIKVEAREKRVEARESELAAERERREAAEVLLRELASLVAGECPRVLDEDSDGDSRLALNIDTHFARYKD